MNYTETFQCKKCKARFDSLDEFVKHNEDCGSFGYEKIRTYAKPTLNKSKPEKKKAGFIQSTPKDAEANEQELVSNSKAAKKIEKTFGKKSSKKNK